MKNNLLYSVWIHFPQTQKAFIPWLICWSLMIAYGYLIDDGHGDGFVSCIIPGLIWAGFGGLVCDNISSKEDRIKVITIISLFISSFFIIPVYLEIDIKERVFEKLGIEEKSKIKKKKYINTLQ